MGQMLPMSGSSVDDLDSKLGHFNITWFQDSAQTGMERYYVGDTASKENAYDMSHENRGYFLIFNNKDFDASTGMAERSGTNLDADALESQFTRFGFKVIRKNNVKVDEMLRIIKQYSMEDHSNMDCFGLAMLSHGDDGIIFGVDDFTPIDKVLTPIKACKTLAGKPKLFIIQACRGSQLDDGLVVQADGTGEKKVKIPQEADCLYAFSTVPGYYSWRNSIRGSWFVQSLIAVLKSEKRPVDLLRLMTRVNRMVAYEFESNSSSAAMNHKKQVPYIASTLTKDLYLLPISK